MPFRPRALVAVLALSLLATAAPASVAAPPTSPECVGLVAGSTGVIEAGGRIPSPEQLQGKPGGFGAKAPAEVARTLPDKVTFKTNRETSSLEYAFAVRAGHLYVRRAEVGTALAGEPWYRLELPACLDGHVRSVSADGRLLVVVADSGQLYVHDMPGGDLSPERWTWRWGSYFWTGQGLVMPSDVRTFAASEETSAEHFTDTSGRERTPLGVATLYLLRGDGRTITYLDPWLPVDDSREVCGPQRGTLPLAGLSGSGSTVFVEDRQGGLWTRMWDFDVSGANTVFGTYSWQRGRPASDTAWQLPGPDWVHQPLPPGTTTDRLSIVKDGLGSSDRVLRVEGRIGTRTGYWEKRISSRTWRFVGTGKALLGTPVSRTPVTRLRADDQRYVGTIGGARVTASDVNPVCSPVHLRVDVASREHLDLVLHLGDGMRQETRARGLDDTPREYNAAIEVPQAAFDHLGAAARRWVQTNLGGRQVLPSPVALTATRLRFLTTCWQLTLDGAPARMDVPRVPPDLGMVVGRATEMKQDGLTPTVCTPSG
ncbi:MAG: hypothetical protein WCD35_12640 [Mycobacteriales bacterium]